MAFSSFKFTFVAIRALRGTTEIAIFSQISDRRDIVRTLRAVAAICALACLGLPTQAARDKIQRQVLDLSGRKIELAFASDTSKNGFAHGDAQLKKGQANALSVQFTTNAYTIMPGPLEVYPGTYALLVMPGEENCTLIFSNNVKGEGAAYNAAQDYGRIQLKLRKLDSAQKGWTLKLVQAGVNTGRLVLDWDKNEATADFTTM